MNLITYTNSIFRGSIITGKMKIIFIICGGFVVVVAVSILGYIILVNPMGSEDKSILLI